MNHSSEGPVQRQDTAATRLRRFLHWRRRRLSAWCCRVSRGRCPRWLCCLFYRPPRYRPELWNDEGRDAEDCTCNLATETQIQCKNNCYNYGVDDETDTFAQPGRAGGYTPSDITCDEYLKAARADGLVSIDCDKRCPKCCHKVALVIWPGVDFHWYRQDDNGNWSHKPGKTAARDRDDSDHPITDPRTADRGPYTEFCGCFCVCKSRVTIQ